VHFLVILSISSSWKWLNEGHHFTTNVPYNGLKHKQLQQGRNNQQQFHKYAMPKKVELWLSSSLNFICCNKALQHF
jgi:hypothetical protein